VINHTCLRLTFWTCALLLEHAYLFVEPCPCMGCTWYGIYSRFQSSNNMLISLEFVFVLFLPWNLNCKKRKGIIGSMLPCNNANSLIHRCVQCFMRFLKASMACFSPPDTIKIDWYVELERQIVIYWREIPWVSLCYMPVKHLVNYQWKRSCGTYFQSKIEVQNTRLNKHPK
jgi:hypothetical protein